MDLTRTVGETLVTTVPGADGAVGVLEPRWYIAIVGHNSERLCCKRLSALGYECFAAAQEEVRTWRDGRKRRVSRMVLPSMVFIRTVERERRTRIVHLPFIKRFMTDAARRKDPAQNAPVAVVPDIQIQNLRWMLEHAERPVSIQNAPFHAGEKVRVVSGRLAGLEGMVRQDADGKSHIYITLDILGCASVEIDPGCLERLPA